MSPTPAVAATLAVWAWCFLDAWGSDCHLDLALGTGDTLARLVLVHGQRRADTGPAGWTNAAEALAQLDVSVL